MLVGITGKIGSGKSTVCKIFNSLGVATFDSDSCAKEQYKVPEVRDSIVALLGNNVLHEGEIYFPYLKKILMENTGMISKVTDIISDRVFQAYINSQKPPFVLFESAILHRIENKFDIIIEVVAEESECISRAHCRNGMDKEFIHSLYATQQAPKNVNYEIVNNSTIENLQEQVKNIYKIILDKTKF